MSDAVPTDASSGGATAAESEVVALCRDLLRIDTSNYGDGSGPGERAAAEHVMGLLTEVGLDPELVESAPGRASVVVRVEGDAEATRERGALLVHGHLDVVPADAADWQVDPFAGEERDGCLWGRGAVDMKDMDAMMLAVLRDVARTGRKPPRDLVFAFFADEEAGGVQGSHWLVEHRPELFDGVTEAISEVGGYSVTVDGRDGDPVRLYLLQTAEKGIAWLKLVAHGRAGHGSQITTDNAVAKLGAAVARIGQHHWPIEITPTVRQFLDGVTEITGVEFDPKDPQGDPRPFGHGGAVRRRDVPGHRQPDDAQGRLQAQRRAADRPRRSSTAVSCPGTRSRCSRPSATWPGRTSRSASTTATPRSRRRSTAASSTPWWRRCRPRTPGAPVLPYCLSGGTDNKALDRLGVRGFGFAPLQLPPDLDFPAMFHGVDERVPRRRADLRHPRARPPPRHLLTDRRPLAPSPA